ncbi:hypothetical protein [Priestia megaterium]|uniref:Uncharacterized protein n=1 Tax=Priestia megaterium TaxID=1404 RepID=A0A6M6DZE6_PRIMG|nr:hypothetical protein [Priestia megaterium]QJX80261.1 hypothetical protein FDZ14_29635 [Priestia megaterium]
MNKNKREYKSDCIRLTDIDTVRIADIDIDEEARRMNHRKIPFRNHREFSKPDSTLREAAMAFALSEDFKELTSKSKEIKLTPEQEKAKQYFNDNKMSLRIKELIKEFNASKETEK